MFLVEIQLSLFFFIMRRLWLGVVLILCLFLSLMILRGLFQLIFQNLRVFVFFGLRLFIESRFFLDFFIVFFIFMIFLLVRLMRVLGVMQRFVLKRFCVSFIVLGVESFRKVEVFFSIVFVVYGGVGLSFFFLSWIFLMVMYLGGFMFLLFFLSLIVICKLFLRVRLRK